MKKITHKTSPVTLNNVSDLAAFLDLKEGDLIKVIARVPDSYKEIELEKKDGGIRKISAPKHGLKIIQRKILDKYFSKIGLHPCAYGFGQGKSIIDNAQKHTKGRYLLTFDIRNFFPSVHYRKVQQIYSDLGCSEETSCLLCKLTTLNYSLPQGAPTSPYVASLALENMDNRISLLARRNRTIYTRYFDDITLSAHNEIRIEPTIIKIIFSEGYKVKRSKIFRFNPRQTKKVTGVLIKPDGSLDIEAREELFGYLNDLKKFGPLKSKSAMLEKEMLSIKGKIAFLMSVNKKRGQNLKKLYSQIKW